ncbi:MAG TPA: o-succinylbenzoate--CoA ligase, partial [Candidatus Lambdaproteobacteria bacterium]|nr:o-succinylbenzoate--CoA ligase [Candidatus Lambdaproteobacteria bacterium]
MSEARLLSDSLMAESQQRVYLSTENTENLLKSMLALWMRGAVAVPLNQQIPEKQKMQMLQQIGCTFSYTELQYEFKSQPTSVNSLQPNPVGNSDAVAGKEVNSINPKDWATIIFTSGSTGSPKAVVHSLANHFYNALGANERMPLNPGDRWLLSLPMSHVSGLAILFRTLLSGAAMVIPAKNVSLSKTLLSRSVTHLSLVPTQLRRLLQTTKGKDALCQLKLILLGGSSIPETLLDQSAQLGLNVQTTYGSTEMASQVATGKSGFYQVLPFREVRIAADNEVEVRGKIGFLGYLDGTGLHQPFDENGWFKTGDIGLWCSKDTKNQGDVESLKITGRKDNMFISGGENIHPEEIERILLQFGKTEQAVVVAVEDTEFGARPVAFLKTGEYFSESNLQNFLEKRLAKFKVPDLFLALPELIESEIKHNRVELSKFAQTQFDLWRKGNTKNNGKTAIFNQWLNQFQLGWMRVALCEEKQIFSLLDLRDKGNMRCLHLRANSRKEVMEWLLAAENRKLLEVLKNGNQMTKTGLKWIPVTATKRGVVKESFEIVRLLADDLPENKTPLYDAQDRGTFKTLLMPEKILIKKSTKNLQSNHSSHLSTAASKTFHSEPECLNSQAPVFKKNWPWEFHEAVFQTGVFLPNLNSMFLLRCLYRRIASGLQFLGWKVQLMRELSCKDNMEHPFWEL